MGTTTTTTTTIDFNQPIEAIIMTLAGRIDKIEDAEARRDKDVQTRHEENRFRLNVIMSLLLAAIPLCPAIFAWVQSLLKH